MKNYSLIIDSPNDWKLTITELILEDVIPVNAADYSWGSSDYDYPNEANILTVPNGKVYL